MEIKSKVFIPSSIHDLYALINDRNSTVNTRNELYQGEDIVCVICIYAENPSEVKLGEEYQITKFLDLEPNVSIVTESNEEQTSCMLKESQEAMEKTIVVESKKNVYMSDLGKWNELLGNERKKKILVDNSYIIHIIRYSVFVNQYNLNQLLYLKVAFWQPVLSDISPIAFQRSIISNILNLKISNLTTRSINISSFEIASNFPTGSLPTFPILLGAYESFTIVTPIQFPIVAIIEKDNIPPILSPQPQLNQRNSIDEVKQPNQTSPTTFSNASTSFFNKIPPSKPIPSLTNLKRKVLKGHSKRISLSTITPSTVISIKDDSDKPNATKKSVIDDNKHQENLEMELKYKVEGMQGYIIQNYQYAVYYSSFHSLYVNYILPNHIYCDNVFSVVFELHYNSWKRRHILLTIIQSDDEHAIDCLHPTIDVGVFYKPTITTVSVEFLSTLPGSFPLCPVEFKDVLTNEVFSVLGLCEIVVEENPNSL
ncbi:Uncharacterized protein QTN25_003250 [Entamoeba marina]